MDRINQAIEATMAVVHQVVREDGCSVLEAMEHVRTRCRKAARGTGIHALVAEETVGVLDELIRLEKEHPNGWVVTAETGGRRGESDGPARNRTHVAALLPAGAGAAGAGGRHRRA